MTNFLTQSDVDNYGRDLVDFSQRAAAQVIAGPLQAIEQQNVELQRRLAIEARHRLDGEVEAAVPNYREIDRDPDWHQWLRTPDPLSSQPRQLLLNDAIAQGDTSRVIAFFKGFERSSVSQQPATPQHRASSPRASTRSSAAGRTYTRAQIAELYSAHRKGAYAGREAEWARQEWDIVRAGAEGRVLDPDFVTK